MTPEEKAKKLGVPLLPKIEPWIKPTNNPNPIIYVCGECGLEVYKIMYYSCPNNNCPYRLGPIFCDTNTQRNKNFLR